MQLGTVSLLSTFYNLKNDVFQITISGSPLETFDFYFPGIDGRFNYNPEFIDFKTVISSNKNRKYSFDFTGDFIKHNQPGRKSYTLTLGQEYRFSDKFYLRYGIRGIKDNNDIGLVDYDNNDIIYARRDINTLEQQLTGKYSINNVMNFNLRVRYYWAYAINNKFYTLREDGYFDENSTYNLNANINQNIWNFDLSYTWWFTPGSLVSILYRNNASLLERTFNTNLNDNLRNVMSNNPNNTISISFRYYIDYNQAKKIF